MNHQVDIADRAEFVRVPRGLIVDDFNARRTVGLDIRGCPAFEVSRKFIVSDDIDGLDFLDGSQVVDDPFHHRLSRDFEQRLSLCEGEGVEAGGVSGGKNEDVHKTD